MVSSKKLKRAWCANNNRRSEEKPRFLLAASKAPSRETAVSRKACFFTESKTVFLDYTGQRRQSNLY